MTTLKAILRLERPLVILDCETTGTNPETDRIVEFAFMMLYPGDQPPKEYGTLVNPEMAIPAATTTVHHITDEDVAHKPTWRQLAGSVAKGFRECDYAGKNVRFDLRLLAAEMARAGTPWSYADAKIVDADRLIQLAEPRTLGDLYRRATGQDLVDAHGALTDVKATVTVLEWLFKAFPKLPTNLDLLHQEQWKGWIDGERKFIFQDRVPVVNFGKKYRGVPMREVEPSFWSWILKESFSDEVKAIAKHALKGEFPKL